MNAQVSAMSWNSIQAEEGSEIAALTNEEAEAVSGGPKGNHRGHAKMAERRRARRGARMIERALKGRDVGISLRF